MTSQNEFFGGKSRPAVKFDNIGDAFKGVIVGSPEIVPRKSLNPPYELEDNLAITLDPVGNGEDADLRTLWVRRSKLSSTIREAYTVAGAKGLEPGGTLAMLFESVDPPKQPGHNGAKVYKVKYTAPAPVSAADASSIFDDE